MARRSQTWFIHRIERVNGRTPTLIDLSWLGSTRAGGVVIPVLVGVLLVLFLFLILHRWRPAAFTLFVICVESGTYRVTTFVVHRDRQAGRKRYHSRDHPGRIAAFGTRLRRV